MSALLLALERELIHACGKFGHLLTNVEEGHVRCRLCRAHFFCAHASHKQVEQFLVGGSVWGATSNLQNVKVTYTTKKPGDQC